MLATPEFPSGAGLGVTDANFEFDTLYQFPGCKLSIAPAQADGVENNMETRASLNNLLVRLTIIFDIMFSPIPLTCATWRARD